MPSKYVFSAGLNEKLRYLLRQLREVFRELHGREPSSNTEFFAWMVETLYGIAMFRREVFRQLYEELKKCGVIDIV